MSKISQIIDKNRFLLLFLTLFIAIFVAFFIWIKIGIKIESMDFNRFKISQLYIKLDNKITLKAKNINILPDNNEQNSSKSTLELIHYMKWIDMLFNKIELTNISIGDQKSYFIYTDNKFNFDNNDIYINANLARQNRNLNLSINQINLKDFNTTFSGYLELNFYDEIHKFRGKFNSYELQGDINLNIDNDILSYEVVNVTAPTIKQFIDALANAINLNSEIKNWIYGYIVATDYRLEIFKGKFNLNSSDLSISELYGKASANAPIVKFHPNVAAATASSVTVTFKNSNLIFDIKDATYENAKANVGLSINNLDSNPNLILDINTTSLYNESINNILKAYDINIPILQNSGTLNSNICLNIDLSDIKVRADGEFVLNNSTLDIAGANFHSNHAKIILKDDKITIKDSHIKNDIFDANFSAFIDTSDQNAKFDSKFNSIIIPDLIDIKNLDDNITLDFKDDAIIKSKILGYDINLSQPITINIPSITPLKPYSKLINDLNLTKADIKITTNDFKNITARVNDANFNLPIISKKDGNYTDDNFTIEISDIITIKSHSGIINSTIIDGQINIFLDSAKINIESNSIKGDFDKNIKFIANNSVLNVVDINRTVKFDHFSGSKNKDELKFDGEFDGGYISITEGKDILKAKGDGISAITVNDILDLNTFSEGIFGLKIIGKNSKNFKADLELKDTYLKDYKIYNQLLAFLDSIPSLLIFKVPDFNNKGFSVQDGIIRLQRIDDNLTIHAIDIKGANADIVGSGGINLSTNDIDITLELKLLKDASTIIDKIPLVNHILLGKDRSISTVITISGTIDKPDIKTQVITDVLTTPFSIIKNTLTLPFVIFD
ncbi:YhdP family protein [Campylobacter vicugnae]|uniref:YhdP family protein n=1 Tax=Campylobacter vicugnae TaxID=1660076 RepID=UPI000A33EA65|nr:AsmA-like C-terminal domain-containing protein [Campylobacter sp. RM9262]